MNVLSLDIGDSRVGVAWGSTGTKIASPVCVLPANEVISCAKSFKNVIDEYQPEIIVCGLPKSLTGDESDQTQHVRQTAEAIGKEVGLPVEFVDERLSSKEAKQILHEQGLTEKQMRGKIDSVAASLFLETWLNGRGK